MKNFSIIIFFIQTRSDGISLNCLDNQSGLWKKKGYFVTKQN